MRLLSRVLLIASIALVPLLPGARPAVAAQLGFVATDPPATLPAIEPRDTKDAVIPLASFQGKPLLLNLWATWCAPCVKELPSLQRLAVATPGLQVVALSVDKGGFFQVGPFLQQHGIDRLTVLVDKTSGTMKGFAAKGLPLTILIDAQGREVGRFSGEIEWDGPEAKSLLIKVLGASLYSKT
jgi:thiol-disulfide isomerase/thioredoxin